MPQGPFQAMMGDFGSDEEKMQALAAQMRGGSALGARLATSSLEPIQKQGQVMQKQADSRAEKIGLQEYRKAQLAQKKESDAARLKVISGITGFSKVSNSAAERFEKTAQGASTVMNLTGRFRPEYAGTLPIAGNLENWVANNLGGSEGMKAQGAWWRDFKKFYENPERHKLFGSALTSSEIAAWKASSITPDMDPAEIQRSLRTLNRMVQKWAAQSVRNAKNKKWDPTYVDGVYDGVLSPEALADPKAYAEQINAELSSQDYRDINAPEGDTPNYQTMSLEELRRLAGE